MKVKILFFFKKDLPIGKKVVLLHPISRDKKNAKTT